MNLNLRNLLVIFLPVVLVTVIDLAAKTYILNRPEMKDFLFLNIAATANKGIIGGYFSDTAKPIFQIPMVALGFFLLVLLYFIQLFAPVKSTLMRVAISLFFGGIFANVCDRFIRGYVVDYLPIGHIITLNLADIVQYVGIALIFALQFRKNVFDEMRGADLWVSPQFQKRYSMQLVVLGFFMVIAFGALSYTFMRVVLNELSVVTQIKTQFLHAFTVFFISLSITFLLFLFLAGKALSAYVAKPILNFEQYLRSLAQGKYNVFQCDEPEFAYLERLSDQVRDRLMEIDQELRQMKVRSKPRNKNEPN